LSDLDRVALESVLDELADEHRQGAHRRAFGARYMDLRARTEAKMRRLFEEAGGEPERASPHYFVLGESHWFLGLADDMEVIELAIRDLPDETTSFTYPDSFTAMGLVGDYGLPYEPRPYHDRVFRLDDLESVIAEYGMPPDPAGAYPGYEHRPFEIYIEVQLWSDGPVSEWLTRNGG